MSIQTEQQRASQTIAELYQNSFFERYWEAIGRFVGWGKPTSIWISVAVVMGVNLLLGVIVSVLLGETQFTTINAILVSAMWVTFSYFMIPLFINTNRRVIKFLELRFTKSLQNKQDINEFLVWANQWIGKQSLQLFVSLGIGLAIAILGFRGIYPTAKFSFGEALIYFINFFHLGVGFYTALSLLAFILRLKNWHLRLYSDNPASSLILFQLDKELRGFMLLAAFFEASLLFLINLIGGFTVTIISISLVFSWIPILALFVLGNQAISEQIIKAKHERLEKLQSKIMELSNLKKMDTDTMRQIRDLMDYHDRVNSSQNSLYNFESYANLIGALTLPVLSVLLGTIDVWQKIFSKP